MDEKRMGEIRDLARRRYKDERALWGSPSYTTLVLWQLLDEVSHLQEQVDKLEAANAELLLEQVAY